MKYVEGNRRRGVFILFCETQKNEKLFNDLSVITIILANNTSKECHKKANKL